MLIINTGHQRRQNVIITANMRISEPFKLNKGVQISQGISHVCLLLNGVQTRVLLPKGVCGDLPAVDYYSRDGRYTDQSYRGNPLF